MTTIATICARGGSQGLPGKNVKILHGRPLIAHSIAQARACAAISRVFVSTDSEEIAAVAREAGAEVPFLRPAELATSSAAKLPVIRHLVEGVEKMGVQVSRIVDLDPTSPLRSQKDIETCLALLDDDTDCVITGYPAEKNPYFNMVERRPDGTVDLVKRMDVPVTSRQEAPEVFAMNASIYTWHRRTLEAGLWNGRTRIHTMPRERSIDIDSPIDFRLVEMLMEEAGR